MVALSRGLRCVESIHVSLGLRPSTWGLSTERGLVVDSMMVLVALLVTASVVVFALSLLLLALLHWLATLIARVWVSRFALMQRAWCICEMIRALL